MLTPARRGWILACALLLTAGQTRAVTIDFEGLPAFSAPGASLPGVVVSAGGGILDEAGAAAVTGLVFPPGSLPTSGVNVLANLFGADVSIQLDRPALEVSVRVVGSIADGAFGAVTLTAFAGLHPVGSVASDPAAIGDSGAPEGVLSIDAGGGPGITTLLFAADPGGTATFLLDDLAFTPVPEPTSLALGLLGLLGLGSLRRG